MFLKFCSTTGEKSVLFVFQENPDLLAHFLSRDIDLL